MCWSHPYVLHLVNHIVLYAMLILLHASVSVRVHASVCVFQYVPLKAWLYRDGFARFSSTRFSLSTIDDKCILSLSSPFIWMMIHSCDSLIFNTEVVPVSLTKLNLCLKHSGKVSFK